MRIRLAALFRLLAICALLAAAVALVAAIRLAGSDIVGAEFIVLPLAAAGTFWMWLSVRLSGLTNPRLSWWAHGLAIVVGAVGLGTLLIMASSRSLSLWGSAFGLACMLSVGVHVALVRQCGSTAA